MNGQNEILSDREKFSELYASEKTLSEIAAVCGCHVASVSRAVTRYGLPLRRRYTKRKAVVAKIKKERPCPVVPGPDFWDKRDEKIWETKGAYSALDGLARKWGCPTTRVLARWHRLRSA